MLAVASEAFELRSWLRRCVGYERLDWPLAFAASAEWGDARLYAVAHGPGPGLAREALVSAWQRINGHGAEVAAVLSIGLCGGLAPELRVNDLCTSNDVSDGTTSWAATPLAGLPILKLLSVNRFLAHPREKKSWRDLGYGIVDMEAAAVAGWAVHHGVRFHTVKVVSDMAGEQFDIDFNRYRDQAGRFSRSAIAFAALRKPWRRAPGLIRMALRGPAASEKLGEFLAGYRF